MGHTREQTLKRLAQVQAEIAAGSGVQAACDKYKMGRQTYVRHLALKKPQRVTAKAKPFVATLAAPQASGTLKCVVLSGDASEVTAALKGLL